MTTVTDNQTSYAHTTFTGSSAMDENIGLWCI